MRRQPKMWFVGSVMFVFVMIIFGIFALAILHNSLNHAAYVLLAFAGLYGFFVLFTLFRLFQSSIGKYKEGSLTFLR